ncbi:MAG: tyrosine-type recombinase/integrase [Bacteroidota bacterium]
MKTTLNSHIPAFNIYLAKERHNQSKQSIFKDYINEYQSECSKCITEEEEDKIIEYINKKVIKNKLTKYKREHLFDAFDAFYNGYLGKDFKILKIIHLFQINKTPIILTKEEIKLIFSLTLNVRHKCFFMLVYYCGAKPSQILHLELRHIHPHKKTIELYDKNNKFVRNLQVSDEIIQLIKECKDLYEPNDLLFNWKDDVLFNKRSLEVAFIQIIKLSKIDKKATLQTLRHSFAIHLLEKCIDVKYVMKLLGLTTKRSEDIYLYHLNEKNIDIIKTLGD